MNIFEYKLTRPLLMLLIAGISCLMNCTVAAQNDQSHKTKLIVVVGAGGEAGYESQFRDWAERWMDALQNSDIETKLIEGPIDQKSSLDQLRESLTVAEGEVNQQTVWLVLIGHGTFDGKQAKFNLEGPDISATELSVLLQENSNETVIINCASSSGPFINALAASGRIIVTSTKSGYEYNFSRFGDYLSQVVNDAVTDSTAFDLDKDGQTSLLEMVLTASQRTAEFYETDKRLSTEHSLIEDNQDGLGTPTEWFRGTRSTKKAKSGNAPDGLRANQLFLSLDKSQPTLKEEKVPIRDEIEGDLEQLRMRKASFTEDEYFGELEAILLKLAELYQGDVID